MLHKVLVRKLTYLTGKGEIEGTLSESWNKPHKRPRVAEQSGISQPFPGLFKEYPFNLIRIRSVTYSTELTAPFSFQAGGNL